MSERNVGRIKTDLREETQTKVMRSENMSRTERTERTTMVVRLHPGQHQKISARSQEVRGVPVSLSHMLLFQPSSSSVRWEGNIHHENQSRPICALEISFSSVPRDIDIKLIPDIQ